MDRMQYGEYARHFIWFLGQEFWLLWQQIYIKKITDNGGVSPVGDNIAWQSLVIR
jgi:hypothetical protein